MSREKFASAKLADFVEVTELYRSPTGAIYKGKYKYDNKFYVLKEKKLSELGRAKDVMNEVKLLQQLRHANVVQCEGWFRDIDRGTLVIVLEYCGGGDLSQIIEQRRKRKERFSESEIWFIFKQICQGVQHLHENGIIHRDIKALNIFYDPIHQKYKVGDLGVSRQVSEQTILVQTFYGTPLYLSPELVENRAYNEKTDIWSLGVLLYELCALKPPFMAPTLMALAKLVVAADYEAISHSYTTHMKRCVAWMLTKDYRKRPSIVQVLDFIEEKVYANNNNNNNNNDNNNNNNRDSRNNTGNNNDGSTESDEDNTGDDHAETESDTASEDSVGVIVTTNKIALLKVSDNIKVNNTKDNTNGTGKTYSKGGPLATEEKNDISIIGRDSLDTLVHNVRPVSSKSSRLVPPPEIPPLIPSLVPPPVLVPPVLVPPVPEIPQPSPPPLQRQQKTCQKSRPRSNSPATRRDASSPNKRSHKHSVKMRSPSPPKTNKNISNMKSGSSSGTDSDTEDILVLVSQARCVAKHRRESTRLRKLLQTRDFLLSSANTNSNKIDSKDDNCNENVRLLHQQLANLRQDLQYLEQAISKGSLPLKIAKRLQVAALVKPSEDEVVKEVQADKEVDEVVLPVYLQQGPRRGVSQSSRHTRDTEEKQKEEDISNSDKLRAAKYEYLKLPNKRKNVQDREEVNEEELRPLPVSQQRLRHEQAQQAINPSRPKTAKNNDMFSINVHFDNNNGNIIDDNDIHNNHHVPINDHNNINSNNKNITSIHYIQNKEFTAFHYGQQARVPLEGVDTSSNVYRPPLLTKRALLAEKLQRLHQEEGHDSATGLLLPSMHSNPTPSSAAQARNPRNTEAFPSDKNRFYNHARHISDICSVMEKDPRFHRQESHVNVLLHPHDCQNPDSKHHGKDDTISGSKDNKDNIDLYESDNAVSSVGHRERPKTAGGRRRLAEDRAAAANAGFVSNTSTKNENSNRRMRHATHPQEGMKHIMQYDNV